MDTVARRAELEASLPVLEELIEGTRDMEAWSVTDGLRAKIQQQITKLEQRRVLINAELSALNNLDLADGVLIANGYPEVPQMLLTQIESDELTRENSVVQAAIGTFSVDSLAHSASITFGQPVPKK